MVSITNDVDKLETFLRETWPARILKYCLHMSNPEDNDSHAKHV